MFADRPTPHKAATLFFGMMILAGLWSTPSFLEMGNPQLPEQVALLLPYLFAAVAIFFPNRWTYGYCALALLVLPAFLLFQIAVLLFATPAPALDVAPWMIVDGLLYWLFHAYAFGTASRDFYAKQEPLEIINVLKFLRPRQRSQNPKANRRPA